jgi:hypothetical protein
MEARTLIRGFLPGFGFLVLTNGQGNPSNGLGDRLVAVRLASEPAHTPVVLIQGHQIFPRDGKNGRLWLDYLPSLSARLGPSYNVNTSLTRELNGASAFIS